MLLLVIQEVVVGVPLGVEVVDVLVVAGDLGHFGLTAGAKKRASHHDQGMPSSPGLRV